MLCLGYGFFILWWWFLASLLIRWLPSRGIAGEGAGRLLPPVPARGTELQGNPGILGYLQQKAPAHLAFGGGAVFAGFLFTSFLMLQLSDKSFPPKFGVDIAGGLLLPVAGAVARFAVLYAA